jgi:formylmethanofuran dehydrogenase subunit E
MAREKRTPEERKAAQAQYHRDRYLRLKNEKTKAVHNELQAQSLGGPEEGDTVETVRVEEIDEDDCPDEEPHHKSRKPRVTKRARRAAAVKEELHRQAVEGSTPEWSDGKCSKCGAWLRKGEVLKLGGERVCWSCMNRDK